MEINKKEGNLINKRKKGLSHTEIKILEELGKGSQNMFRLAMVSGKLTEEATKSLKDALMIEEERKVHRGGVVTRVFKITEKGREAIRES